MRKHPHMDRMDGSEMEMHLRISRKKPYGWSVKSVNLKNLKNLGISGKNQTWFMFRSNQQLDPEEWSIVLRASRRDPILVQGATP